MPKRPPFEPLHIREKQIYTLKEVSAITSLSEPTIRRMMKDRSFPKPMRIGKRRIAWSQGQINAWMLEKRFPSAGLQRVNEGE